MGIFKHKKDEEVKIQLEREAIEKLNNNDFNFLENPTINIDGNIQEESWKISGKIKAPHSITAEELNSKSSLSKNTDDVITEEIAMQQSDESKNSPTEFLFQKMMQSRAKNLENSINSEEVVEISEIVSEEIPPEKVSSPLDIEAAIEDIKNTANLKHKEKEFSESPAAITEDIIEDTKLVDKTDEDKTKKAKEDEIFTENKEAFNIPTSSDGGLSKISGNAEERRVTLLARCNAYLEDAADAVKIDTEKYKLESVESILESFEARATERVNKKFNISIPSTDNKEAEKKTVDASSTTTFPPVTPSLSDTVVFKAPVTKTEKSVTAAPSTTKEAKHLFTANTNEAKREETEIDDLSSTRIISNIKVGSKPQDIYSSSKTTIFPAIETVVNTSNGLQTTSSVLDNKEEQEDKPSFDDYANIEDRPRILSSLLHKKKTFSLKLWGTLFCFVISLLFITPSTTEFIGSQKTANIFDLVLCVLMLVINLGTLNSLKTLFNPKAKGSLPAALSIISALLFSILNLIFSGEFTGLCAIAGISLLSYNLAIRNFYSKTVKNFNSFATTDFKNAVSIIQNKNATKTIVDNSIEGNALVCYGGETTNIHNFLRYTFSPNPISGKIQKLSLISVIVGFLFAIITLVFNTQSSILPLYIFCATVCFSAIPSVYHIVSLTINSANKRLNHYDAMITGYQAADELELCNAVAISSDQLFPEGTVRLVDMKLLSPNPFDQSILDAAAIASNIHSPLAGIFRQMDASKAYTGAMPEVDSVIYEEKMGISGWVNDRRVFVGNRDLLTAHGFVGLPPAELDKKIMRKGYFPVYIASDNIPCALLVVKYEPDEDIVYEMQRLANTGTTIIVDNCDPNINAQMLTDYFELYSETVFVMNKRGSDFYKALTEHKEHRRAGAAFKSRIEGLLAALTASINIKKYVSRMTAFYICSVVLGMLGVITCILTSLTSLISPLIILLVQLLLTAITLLPTVLRKP